MLRVLGFLVLALLIASGGASVRTETYCSSLRMQVHGATEAAKPAILYIHGGGWESGSRKTGYERRMIRPLTRAGFVVTTIDYRLAPEHTHPAQAIDAACAVRYMRANAARLGIDPARIGVMGDSAGGHLAALTALAGDRFENAEWAGVSSEVSAVAAFYGVFDVMDYEPSLASGVVEQNFPTPALRRSGSPVTYVTRKAPPFLLFHGKNDHWVNVAQSVKMAVQLKNAGHKPLLVTVEHADHGFFSSGGKPEPSLDRITRLLVTFFLQTV